MNRTVLSACLATSALTATMVLTPRPAAATLNAQEAATACESVISRKPGLGNFQHNETKAEPFYNGWLVTGAATDGSDRRPFTCKIDDKGRVTTAILKTTDDRTGK